MSGTRLASFRRGSAWMGCVILGVVLSLSSVCLAVDPPDDKPSAANYANPSTEWGTQGLLAIRPAMKRVNDTNSAVYIKGIKVTATNANHQTSHASIKDNGNGTVTKVAHWHWEKNYGAGNNDIATQTQGDDWWTWQYGGYVPTISVQNGSHANTDQHCYAAAVHQYADADALAVYHVEDFSVYSSELVQIVDDSQSRSYYDTIPGDRCHHAAEAHIWMVTESPGAKAASTIEWKFLASPMMVWPHDEYTVEHGFCTNDSPKTNPSNPNSRYGDGDRLTSGYSIWNKQSR